MGFEIEFSGVELDEVARLIVELFGGRVRDMGRFEHQVVDSLHGSLRVEVD